MAVGLRLAQCKPIYTGGILIQSANYKVIDLFDYYIFDIKFVFIRLI
jgi:hypothetical protein